MPFTSVAFAAGFRSVRQFNETVQSVFAASPTQLRAARSDRCAAQGVPGAPGAPGTVTVDLAVRQPLDLGATMAFLAARAIRGVEHFDGARYHRALALPSGHGIAIVDGLPVVKGDRLHVRVALQLADWRDLAPAVGRVRRLFDLDSDPVAIDSALGGDPFLADLVARRPGLRVPGSVDPFETAVRAVVGQQVSVAGARTILGRLVDAVGTPLTLPHDRLTHVFPSPAELAAIDPARLPMPMRRRTTLTDLADRVALGKIALDAGADRDEVRRMLLDVPGIGPWTADYVLLRGLGDPDVFLASDLGVIRALDELGATASAAEAWRPWRSYAVHHLWERSRR
jgi:AraC family transcriptional regulator of adaptative response / DNA-3-methyladenine glycosylase II